MRFTLEQFEDFLKTVDLKGYKKKYQHCKTVEQNLPRSIHALNTLYSVYWKKDGEHYDTPPTFEEFYEIYYKTCKAAIDKFRDSSGYGKKCGCFKNGLEARIYRTWSGIITQIHAGYLAESIFGKDTVEQGTDLDHKNIDFIINKNGKTINVQVKKETMRTDFNGGGKIESDGTDTKYIYYFVPSDYDRPHYPKRTKNHQAGDEKEWFHMFSEYDPENGFLDRFENGFVVFNKKTFKDF